MREALRSYLQIATGLTEMTVQRVTEAAKQLVEKSGVDIDHVPAQVAQQAQAVPQYVQQVADDLFATGKANRDLLVGVVRGEVDKAMSRLRPWVDDVNRVDDDLARVERRVTDLEHRLAVAAAAPRAPRVQAVPEADEEPVPVRRAGSRASAPAVPAGAAEEPDAPVARHMVTPARTAKKAAAKKSLAKAPAEAPAKSVAKSAAKAVPATTAPATAAPAKKTAGGTKAKKTTPRRAVPKLTARPTLEPDAGQ